jgi:hypothetical protein
MQFLCSSAICAFWHLHGEYLEHKLGRGAMVAQRTLDPFILVRIQAPQPDQIICQMAGRASQRQMRKCDARFLS